MALISHPDLDTFIERMKALRSSARSWSGVAYRFSTKQYSSNHDQLSGAGSAYFGGRWNPVGIPTVYSSETPEAAMAESLANVRYYESKILDALPRILVGMRFKLRKVIDLTDGSVRNRLKVSEKRMLESDWHRIVDKGDQPLTQAIGEAAYRAGYEAIRTPSAADVSNGVSLVYFPDNLKTNSVAEVAAGMD